MIKFKGWRFIVKDLRHDSVCYISDFVFESKQHAGNEARLFIEHYYNLDGNYGWAAEEEK